MIKVLKLKIHCSSCGKNVHIHLLKVLKVITEYQIITLVIVVEQDTLMIDF